MLSGGLALIFFTADVILPRGATAAIGYCLVPAVAAGVNRRGFTLLMTLACTVLTWVAIVAEPAGAPTWQSAFDRIMVTGVLWFTLLLIQGRTAMLHALVGRTRALRETTQKLEESNAELDRFASVVAHDLRGPLNTIGLLAQLLAGPGTVNVEAGRSESIDAIMAEVMRMNGLIQSLLTYGRAGSANPRLADCDCAAVLVEVHQILKADLEKNHVELTSDPLPTLRADPVLIGELFQNLIENSIKYHGNSAPKIHVSARPRDGGWEFSVRDNGIGVRPEDARLIFEPFHQSNGDRTSAGVGLGLATCKRIVQRHGGQIEVRSHPGEGADFVFTLPRQA